MKKTVLAVVAFILAWGLVISANAQKASQNSGEAKFKELCSICHPDGGNIVNPKKTLHKKVREANNIKTESDIMKLMRHPGPGMTTFDEKTVPDKTAKEIANYVIMTFK